MKKAIALLLLIVIISFALVSCVKDVVTYCPYCGTSDIREDKEGYYQCKSPVCGRKFGARIR